jgi:hypothetical protein
MSDPTITEHTPAVRYSNTSFAKIHSILCLSCKPRQNFLGHCHVNGMDGARDSEAKAWRTKCLTAEMSTRSVA